MTPKRKDEIKEEDEDDIPELVGTFEEASKKE